MLCCCTLYYAIVLTQWLSSQGLVPWAIAINPLVNRTIFASFLSLCNHCLSRTQTNKHSLFVSLWFIYFRCNCFEVCHVAILWSLSCCNCFEVCYIAILWSLSCCNYFEVCHVAILWSLLCCNCFEVCYVAIVLKFVILQYFEVCHVAIVLKFVMLQSMCLVVPVPLNKLVISLAVAVCNRRPKNSITFAIDQKLPVLHNAAAMLSCHKW